jgi:pimeloyl-ACP methyl ester carboxylesterase
MSFLRLAIAAVLCLAGGAACAPIPPPTVLPPPAAPGYLGYRSSRYADDALWLCRPDLPRDRCRADLSATEIHPDRSRTVVPFVPAAAPKVDCFYVYPTVDLSIVPGNHTDFADLEPMARTAAAQFARLGEVCRLYAPLYRQITIGTYVFGKEQREERLSVAFSDVADAFAHYLGQHNQGRKIVLVGHSQGAEMVVRLLRRFFEDDPVIRERLLLALPIGGWVEVPPGKVTGGTFASIPVCTRPDELGCVVAYRTHREGSRFDPGPSAPAPGMTTVCVNPADREGAGDGERRPFSRTLLPANRRLLRGLEGVTTPFVIFPSYYAGRCVDGPRGYRYLAVSEVSAPGDRRESPFDLSQMLLDGAMGTHILDFQFPQGDLLDLVARRAAQIP